MGYGAYMTIQNQRSEAIRTFITEVQCMHDDGEEGSNLSLFNDARIESETQLPRTSGQYIEAKASGTCFFKNALFNLKIQNDETHDVIGQVAFQDRSKAWHYNNENEDAIAVYVDNRFDQGVITVTVKG